MASLVRARRSPRTAALGLAVTLVGTGCFQDADPPAQDAAVVDLGADLGAESAVDVGARDVVREDLPPRELRPVNVDLTLRERAPASFVQVSLPMGAEPVAPWVSSEGEGLVVARDGRFFAIDGRGGVTGLERLPDDPRAPGDAPVATVLERTPDDVVALVPTGVLTYRGGWVRREAFSPLLATARATVRWGDASLWLTGQGVYTTQGTQWLQLERMGAAVTDAVAAVAGPASSTEREAWVLRSGGALERLRVRPMGMGLEVVWSDPVVGLPTTMVQAVASHGGYRYIARAADLVRVDAAGRVERLRVPGVFAGPVALVSAGPWLWAAWEGMGESLLARTDGTVIEVVARGLGVTAPRVAVDRSRGDVALVVDGPRVTRVEVEPRLGLAGFDEGTVTDEPRLALRAVPPPGGVLESVRFALDGREVETRTEAPWGWSESGEAVREFPMLTFGGHAVTVTAQYRGAPALTRTRRFVFVSPLGRVPTYMRDVAPVYAQRCARCHSTGIARDLRGYDRLRAQAPVVASVVRSRRMPPDLTMDAPSIALITAWAAGGAPP